VEELFSEDLPLGITGGSEEATSPTPIIGTLQESGLHQALKAYYQPDTRFWEQKVGRFVADIYDGRTIIEIQTGNFAALREKLACYTEAGIPAKVVFPLRVEKHLYFEDEQGNFLRQSKGKQDSPVQFLAELWSMWKNLSFDSVSFDLVRVCVAERRVSYPNRGYGKRHRLDSDLLEVRQIDSFVCPNDLLRLLPETLTDPFTQAEFQKATKAGKQTAAKARMVLSKLGLLSFAGKSGKAFLYTRTPYGFPEAGIEKE